MADEQIHAVTMPKWGLSMTEGRVVDWQVEEGSPVQPGDELLDVETDKIAGAVEATQAGVLRRRVARPDQLIPVQGLLGVIAAPEIDEAAIDAFAKRFEAEFVPEEPATEEAPGYLTIEVAGRPLRYVAMGQGADAVLLVHGFGGDLDNWLFNHEPLASACTVYALDLPGHGGSHKDVGEGNLEKLVAAVTGFMDAVDLSAAHLVGHSLGAAVVARLAAEQPRRALSLALIAPAGLGTKINAGYIEGFVSSATRRELKPHLQSLFADPSLVNRKLVDDVLKYKRLDGVTEALQRIADAVFPGGTQRESVRDGLAQLAVPVLVIWGSQDQVIPAAHGEGLSKPIRVRILDGAGHMVQMEAATEVNRLLTEQFEKPRGQGE
jgi:pyruvate dehydrogenase E2 component (dihydrolipoamide acetyltransferase)